MPAQSTDSQDKDQASEQSEDTVESRRPRDTTEEEGLVDLAESIHINPPDMATMTKAPITEAINEHMGHCTRCIVNIVDNKAALQHAIGPDRADSPSGGPEMLPKLPPIQLPQDN